MNNSPVLLMPRQKQLWEKTPALSERKPSSPRETGGPSGTRTAELLSSSLSEDCWLRRTSVCFQVQSHNHCVEGTIRRKYFALYAQCTFSPLLCNKLTCMFQSGCKFSSNDTALIFRMLPRSLWRINNISQKMYIKTLLYTNVFFTAVKKENIPLTHLGKNCLLGLNQKMPSQKFQWSRRRKKTCLCFPCYISTRTHTKVLWALAHAPSI